VFTILYHNSHDRSPLVFTQIKSRPSHSSFQVTSASSPVDPQLTAVTWHAPFEFMTSPKSKTLPDDGEMNKHGACNRGGSPFASPMSALHKTVGTWPVHPPST
jgi:hypothetical protein